MPSLFYEAAFQRRFPLPYLFFEDIQIRSHELGPDAEDDQFLDSVIRGALGKCLGMDKVSDDDIAYVVARLEKVADELEKDKEKEAEPASKKQSFATSFAAWVTKLDPHDVCMLLAEYNYDKAYHLYTKVDRDDVSALSEQWMHREWERVKVGYESVVYGFGGGYEDRPTADVDVSTEDHTEGTAIDRSILDAIKF